MSEHLYHIYEVWDGNAEALATDIAELGVTVRQWRNRGDIPSRAWPKIIHAAAARGTVLRLEDSDPGRSLECRFHGDDSQTPAIRSVRRLRTRSQSQLFPGPRGGARFSNCPSHDNTQSSDTQGIDVFQYAEYRY